MPNILPIPGAGAASAAKSGPDAHAAEDAKGGPNAEGPKAGAGQPSNASAAETAAQHTPVLPAESVAPPDRPTAANAPGTTPALVRAEQKSQIERVSGVAVGVTHEVGDLQSFQFQNAHDSAATDPAQGGADTVSVAFEDSAEEHRIGGGPAVKGTVTVDNVNNTVTVSAHERGQGATLANENVYGYSTAGGWVALSGEAQEAQNGVIESFGSLVDIVNGNVVLHKVVAGDTVIELRGARTGERPDSFGVQVGTAGIERSTRPDVKIFGSATDVRASSGDPGSEGTLSVVAGRDGKDWEEFTPRPVGFVNKEFAAFGNADFWSSSNVNLSNLDSQDDGWWNWF